MCSIFRVGLCSVLYFSVQRCWLTSICRFSIEYFKIFTKKFFTHKQMHVCECVSMCLFVCFVARWFGRIVVINGLTFYFTSFIPPSLFCKTEKRQNNPLPLNTSQLLWVRWCAYFCMCLCVAQLVVFRSASLLCTRFLLNQLTSDRFQLAKVLGSPGCCWYRCYLISLCPK